MTKTESTILNRVSGINSQGGLAGLGTSPEDSDFGSKQHRFVKRLYESGALVWVGYTKDLGSGWAVAGSSLIPKPEEPGKPKRHALTSNGVELVVEDGKLTIPGKSNYGQPRQDYADKLATMSDEELLEACKTYIYLSARSNNNHRSDYHWMCDACYLEGVRRGNDSIYSKAHKEVSST